MFLFGQKERYCLPYFYGASVHRYCTLTIVLFSVVLYFLQLSWACWLSWTSYLSTMPVTASLPEEPQSSLFLDLRFVIFQLKLNLNCVLLKMPSTHGLRHTLSFSRVSDMVFTGKRSIIALLKSLKLHLLLLP